jgi:electron transfer flavoprotein beta subunit
MNLFVLLKMVPDTVEELELAADGKALDSAALRFKLSDPDEHALEEALILKERHGGKVTVVALESPELDDVLHTALAKGADRAVRLAVDQTALGSVATAKVFADFFKSGAAAITPDTLLLPGAQAYDDLEGELAPYLASALQLPYLGVVCSVKPINGKLVAVKEFSGGLRGEFELPLPAVLGIQSAEKPPHYVPIAKVMAMRRTSRIETVDVPAPEQPAAVSVARMYKPEIAAHAQMLEGSPEEVAERIAGLLAERGLI